MKTTGTVTAVQRFSLHDGPGVRTTVFLKGCPLHCPWCHNPETRNPRPQVRFLPLRCIACGACVEACPAGCHTLDADGVHRFDATGCTRCWACVEACLPQALTVCGQEMGVDEVLDLVERDRAFYADGSGGLTLSGGEPLAQPEFALALLRGARARGLSTCVETCGEFPSAILDDVADLCDHILWDIKDTDAARLAASTGADAARILARLERVCAHTGAAAKVTLRCIVLDGRTDADDHIDRVVALARRLGIPRVELLPFHPFGSGKFEEIGDRAAAPPGRELVPDEARVASLRRRIADAGLALR